MKIKYFSLIVFTIMLIMAVDVHSATINANEQNNFVLAAGNILTIAAPPGTTGSVVRLSRIPGGSTQSITAINGATLYFGAYGDVERFKVICDVGTVTVTQGSSLPLAGTLSSTDASHSPTNAVVVAALATKMDAVTATAENDFIVSGATPFAWEKKTLAEVKTILFSGEVAPGTLILPEKTPVNAVAASKVLTIGTLPAEGATVSIGGKVYKFRAAIGAGAKATGTLTFNSELPHDGDTVRLGAVGNTYTFKDALTGDGTIGKEILIEATVTATIDNLVAAVMTGTGAATKFSTDCPILAATITATKATADTFAVEYNTVGFTGNSFDTLGTLTHATWGATALAGGVDAQAANDVLRGINVEAAIDNLVLAITAGAGIGTNYGTGTTANTYATAAKASAETMTATNLIKGVVGNSTALAESLADGSWAGAATFLSGGVDGTVGVANETCADASYIYHTPAANTIADANWRRIGLGSVY